VSATTSAPPASARDTAAELTDGQVVARVLAGDRPLFELLVRRYNQRLFRAARAILRNDADAEDALQEAWVKAFEHLGQFRGEASFATWVTRITIHAAFAQRRRSSKLVLVSDHEEMLEEMPRMQAPLPTPEDQAANAELRRAIETAVDTLPETLRVAYVVRDVEGLDTRDAAAALGISESALKVRLHRARAALRHVLERRLATASRQVFPFLGERCDRLTAAVMTRVLES
jgi:RNA polymerase sigma-70 factor (ECF subfamily)